MTVDDAIELASTGKCQCIDCLALRALAAELLRVRGRIASLRDCRYELHASTPGGRVMSQTERATDVAYRRGVNDGITHAQRVLRRDG